MVGEEWPAVHPPRQQGADRQRRFRLEAECIVDRPLGLYHALIGAGEHELGGNSVRSDLFENATQRHSGELAHAHGSKVPRRALRDWLHQRSAITCALQGHHFGGLSKPSKIVEGENPGSID